MITLGRHSAQDMFVYKDMLYNTFVYNIHFIALLLDLKKECIYRFHVIIVQSAKCRP